MPTVKTDYNKWIEQIDKMLSDPTYSFAWDRLENLKDWIVSNETITGDIIKAIQDLQKRAGDL